MAGRRTVGLGLFTGQRPPGVAHPPYGDAVLLARAAEDAGFDAFWVSEHHGMPDGYLPSPLVLLGALAAATDRLTLGSGVALAPLHHPLRLAEDAAVLDHLSGGRLVLGLGLGYAEHEYAAFGVDPTRRGALMSDLVPFLRRAWTGEAFDWSGPAYAGQGLRVTPAPLRDGIPVWLGGYAPAALQRARRVADGYLVGRADDAILDRVLPAFAEPVGRPFTIAVNALVLLTDDPADADAARRGYAATQTAYEAMQAGGIAHAGIVAPDPEAPVTAGSVDRYFQAVGPAGAVVARLRELLDRLPAWADAHLVLRVLFPEPDARRQADRVARLGRDVLPGLR
ncbi:LLM class flavin-dependent oxidoreductase [Geodermatophilus sabuli]|uniref:LLM class flavin-dependent oxidoreductase n=1 Tax=Geodermatophilus sabuli TaxID=1564158 RepID=A0A7K3W3C0_9ACTN|nr:LLM class flavin-dependent oxidoreductase [Geodermatophilus sabuli]NEK58427.1 LLM class flavin-dependent oxidoreductase [Geodermatophilus sabuli]